MNLRLIVVFTNGCETTRSPASVSKFAKYNQLIKISEMDLKLSENEVLFFVNGEQKKGNSSVKDIPDGSEVYVFYKRKYFADLNFNSPLKTDSMILKQM